MTVNTGDKYISRTELESNTAATIYVVTDIFDNQIWLNYTRYDVAGRRSIPLDKFYQEYMLVGDTSSSPINNIEEPDIEDTIVLINLSDPNLFIRVNDPDQEGRNWAELEIKDYVTWEKVLGEASLSSSSEIRIINPYEETNKQIAHDLGSDPRTVTTEEPTLKGKEESEKRKKPNSDLFPSELIDLVKDWDIVKEIRGLIKTYLPK